MAELLAILVAKREKEYEERKFLAAIQGIDLDSSSSKSTNAWEDMKARVFSGGTAKDSSDITSLQGYNAERAGFGIGMGLDYDIVSDRKSP
jgi:translation initiation factor 1 (eIF-1/SUI1)